MRTQSEAVQVIVGIDAARPSDAALGPMNTARSHRPLAFTAAGTEFRRQLLGAIDPALSVLQSMA